MKTLLAWICLVLAALAVAACEESRQHPTENTASTSAPLTFAASRVYTISAANFGESWCPHGTVATDAASRCADPTQTVIARLPITYDANSDGAPDPCHPVTASLTLQRQEWSSTSFVDVRRILRPVIDPPEGLAASCAPGGVAAWDTSGSQPWTVLGALGFGTDASVSKASFTAPADGTQLVTVDLTTYDANGAPLSTLVDDCAPTGVCVLGLYASAHVWIYPGTVSLFVTCSAGPAGGTGGSGGAGGSTTSSSSTPSGGACQ